MQTISVAGGNLFAIAASELADATQWIRIAQINGFDDPQLVGLTALLLPGPQPAGTGGIVQQ